jgi:sigma-E factor negative regulatory protein RseA
MNPFHETDPDTPQGEQVSALCDGILEPRELDALLARCRADDEVQARWHGYQVIGEVLRGQTDVLPSRAPSEFLQRLRAGLAEQAPAPAMPQPSRVALPLRGEAANDAVFRWKLASGFASVVAVAAIGWNVLATTAPVGAGDAQLVQAAPAVAPAAATAPSAVAVAPASEVRPVIVATPQGRVMRDAALERLLAAHRQNGGMSAFQTSTGFIRNATYDADAR